MQETQENGNKETEETTIDQAKKIASEKFEQMKNISSDDLKQKADDVTQMAKSKFKDFNQIQNKKIKYGIVGAFIILLLVLMGGKDAKSEIIKALDIQIEANHDMKPNLSDSEYKNMRCKVLRNTGFEILLIVSSSITSNKNCENILNKIPVERDALEAKADQLSGNEEQYIIAREHMLAAEEILINDYCEESKDFEKWAKEAENDLLTEYCPSPIK